jgi:dTDP-4-amino-4,6-dideoxygalactose transaminase
VDVRPDTLNLDEDCLRGAITARTRAIVLVHYAGVGCNLQAIMAIANQHALPVVEDNAHGLFGRYQGQYLGTFGALATQSFHETKNFTCGEGGALLINDPRFIERAEILREKGTNRSRFFRGQIDKYSWVDIGSSYLPSDMLAAFLFSQLEARERVQARRGQIWEKYRCQLQAWATTNGVRLPTVPTECEQPAHLFYMLMPTLAARQALISHLRERGILAVFHYLPLHLSDMGRQWGGAVGDCPVTESISERLLRLPLYYSMSEAEQDEVLQAVIGFSA